MTRFTNGREYLVVLLLSLIVSLQSIAQATAADARHGSSRWGLAMPRGGSRDLPQQENATTSTTTVQLVKDTTIHNGWRKLINRQVLMTTNAPATTDSTYPTPANLTVNFEIVSQGDRGGTVSDQAVLVFVWNSTQQTATLVQEYMPSVHDHRPGLAAGMVEAKHGKQTAQKLTKSDDDNDSTNILTAAQHELEEECRLRGGIWHRLCAPTVMDKYTTTQLSVYLVTDPVQVDNPLPRDETEVGMEIRDGISVPELERMVQQGEFTVVGGWAVQLAIAHLRRTGKIE